MYALLYLYTRIDFFLSIASIPQKVDTVSSWHLSNLVATDQMARDLRSYAHRAESSKWRASTIIIKTLMYDLVTAAAAAERVMIHAVDLNDK